MDVKHWWTDYPWRMIQTNLRETDMADIDAEAYAQQLADYGATVVTLNAAGIIASYQTKLDFQTQSPYLTGSSLMEMIEACHKRGIRVIARTDFSKIREPIFEKHPDWAYRDKKRKWRQLQWQKPNLPEGSLTEGKKPGDPSGSFDNASV